MKIAHFNTFPYGGAAVAAFRIYRGIANLREPNLTSRFYYRIDDRQICGTGQKDHHSSEQTPIDAADIERLDFATVPSTQRTIGYWTDKLFFRKRKRQRLIQWHNRHLRARSKSLETFSLAEQFDSTSLPWDQLQSDLVHMHWISYMADYPSFFDSIPRHVPIVWTLHDMNPFTGGCHYAGRCEGFVGGCGNCPQLINPKPNDASRGTWRAKRKALQDRGIAVVSPCDWLRKKAEQSPIWPSRTTFHTIRYGLDLQQFYPVERKEARRLLGLEMDCFLIAFGAEDVSNPRKGFKDLSEALRQIQQRFGPSSAETSDRSARKKVEGLVFGSGQLKHETGVRLNHVGYLSDLGQLRLVYSAADVVVVPSLEDNQPQVALEAMACGRPIVGRNAAGVPEIIRNGETGFLATDVASMVKSLLDLIENPQLTEDFGKQARSWMEQEFEIGRQSKKYLELYCSAIKG